MQIDDIKSCIEKITNSDEYIFLIVSDQYVEELLPKIHHLYQLNSVFITSDILTASGKWIKEYPKIEGIYNNFEVLQTDMQNAVNTFLKYESVMPEVFDPTKIAQTMNMCRGDLWLIKLFYVLIRQLPPNDSKEYFFNVFSEYYKNNTKNNQLLTEFMNTYDPLKAIWWYSKDTFIYRVLNKALRERNIQIMCAFHFFIQDLYKSIEHGHRLFKENGTPMFTYRGQKIHQVEIDRIKEAHHFNVRLSINSLLSTTLDRNVAVAFIDGFKPEGNLRGVLFEIECNANLTSRPFMEITGESYFEDEQEVLFTPGIGFMVNSIELNELCTIQLRLCDEQEILIGIHKEHMFRGDRNTVQELFVNMGENSLIHDCSDLDQLYNYVTKLFPSDQLIEAEYLQAIGSKKFQHQDFESSIDDFKECLALKQQILSSEHIDIAQLYWHIGESYFQLSNYTQAIHFCQKAINSNLLSPLYNSRSHFHVGCSYMQMQRETDINWEDISIAKDHFRTALNISLEYERTDHPITMDIYHALADINYNYEDDFDSAIANLTNALDICAINGWIDDYKQIQEDIETIKINSESERNQT